jgi:predicted secreted protein
MSGCEGISETYFKHPIIQWSMIHMKRLTLLLCFALFLVPIETLECFGQSETKQVRLHQPFQISVTSNPSTGYQWKAQFDSQIIKLESKKHARDASKPKHFVGAPGMTTFAFTAIRTGKTTIKLLYMRPWEKKIIKTKVYNVEISR